MSGFSDWLIYLTGLLTIIILCVFGLINAARFLLVCFYQNYALAAFVKRGPGSPHNVTVEQGASRNN